MKNRRTPLSPWERAGVRGRIGLLSARCAKPQAAGCSANRDVPSPDSKTRPALPGREGERGATALEWTLLVAAIALPSYFIIRMSLDTLVGHYQMMSALNALPFP